MTVPYPSNKYQEETARARGWTPPRFKSEPWTKPHNFTANDQERIDRAEARRVRRAK